MEFIPINDDLCSRNDALKTPSKPIQFMLFSTLCFAAMNLLIKYLVHFPTFELVFFRSLSSLVITAVVLKTNKISFRPNRPAMLVLRGIVGVTSMALFFLAAHYIPIGSAVTIRYIAPLFAAVMALFFLKEKIYPLQWIFFFAAFFGVVLIKGFSSDISLFGVSLVVISALFSASVYIIIAKIGQDDHSLLVVFYFMLIATLVGGIGGIFGFIIPTIEELFLLLILGVFGFFGQLFMTKAFQAGNASSIAPIKYVEVVFTVSFGIYWFGELYTVQSFVGMFLVIFSLSLNSLYKARKAR